MQEIEDQTEPRADDPAPVRPRATRPWRKAQQVEAAMVEHKQRAPEAAPERKKAVGLRQELTGAQRLKRWRGEHTLELDAAFQASPLWDGRALTRRSVCARLRELELHPDRVERIKARP